MNEKYEYERLWTGAKVPLDMQRKKISQEACLMGTAHGYSCNNEVVLTDQMQKLKIEDIKVRCRNDHK